MKVLIALCLSCLLLGCTSVWDERVEVWTYDDVVRELGPADLVEDLRDGTRVVTYFRERTQSHTTYVYESRGRHSRRRFPSTVISTPSVETRREIFVFHPNGTLESRRFD